MYVASFASICCRGESDCILRRPDYEKRRLVQLIRKLCGLMCLVSFCDNHIVCDCGDSRCYLARIAFICRRAPFLLPQNCVNGECRLNIWLYRKLFILLTVDRLMIEGSDRSCAQNHDCGGELAIVLSCFSYLKCCIQPIFGSRIAPLHQEVRS